MRRGERLDTADPIRLGLMYLDLKDFVLRAGYGRELDWQAEVDFEATTETDFLREAAWVVLSAGLSERLVRRRFGLVSSAFLEWCNATEIGKHRERCRSQAMMAFAHRAKIDAIVSIVSEVAEVGYECVKESIRQDSVSYLQRLPYIGPVTSYHLAKNLGFAVVKPDRHLERISKITGHASPLEMCTEIADVVGDSLPVVDVVCWRFATLTRHYEEEIGSLLGRQDEEGL